MPSSQEDSGLDPWPFKRRVSPFCGDGWVGRTSRTFAIWVPTKCLDTDEELGCDLSVGIPGVPADLVEVWSRDVEDTLDAMAEFELQTQPYLN